MFQPQWFHWASLGVVLIVAEMLIPAFVLVWFGLGALIVALLADLQLVIAPVLQVLIWIALSAALLTLWVKLFKSRQTRTLAGRASAGAVGEVGLLVSDVAPFQNGSVRFQRPVIGSQVWACIADEAIATGSRVRIVSVEGSLLKIAPVSPSPNPGPMP